MNNESVAGTIKSNETISGTMQAGRSIEAKVGVAGGVKKGVEVDATLTIEGAAADAKAVGDAIEVVGEDVNALYERLNTNNVLRFYCVEDVAVIVNGVSVE